MPSSHNETNVRRMAKRYGIDIDTYDWRAHWDSELSEQENMDRFRKDFERLADPLVAVKIRFEDVGKKEFERFLAEHGVEPLKKKKLKEVGV